jgi:hypothetical protein
MYTICKTKYGIGTVDFALFQATRICCWLGPQVIRNICDLGAAQAGWLNKVY